MSEVAESVAVFTMPPNDTKPNTSSSFVPLDAEVCDLIIGDIVQIDPKKIEIIKTNNEPLITPRVTPKEPNNEPLITPRVTPKEPKKSRMTKTPIRVQRLDRSIGASEKMASIMEAKNIIYENYLKEKISLMRRDCEAKERIAAALELFAASKQNNN